MDHQIRKNRNALLVGAGHVGKRHALKLSKLFDKLPANLQLGIVGFILMGEGASMLKGWKNPFENGTSNYFKLKDDYQPGDLGFEISNHDDVDFHNKELNNGRLAMIAVAGMVAQELVTNKPLLFSNTLW